MIWFKKASSWLVNHWQYAAVSVLAIVAYVLGSNKHKALKIQADLAKRQYKKEAYMMDKEYQAANEKKKNYWITGTVVKWEEWNNGPGDSRLKYSLFASLQLNNDKLDEDTKKMIILV